MVGTARTTKGTNEMYCKTHPDGDHKTNPL